MNHVEEVNKRIYWQFKNAPKLVEWLEIIPSILQTEAEEPLEIIADILDIDNREGEQLDIIGRIVGISRPPIDQAAEGVITSFGGVTQFGDSGAQFSPATQSISAEASDSLFRVLIKARIERNNGDATIDSIVRAARYVTGVQSISVNDNQDMTWSVSFGNELDSVTRFALANFDILPRPQGTRFMGFIESASYTQFGAEFAHFGDERAQFNEVFI